MKIIIFLAACLAVSSATVLNNLPLSQRARDNPTRCCLPKHWQAYIGETVIPQGGQAFDVLFEYAVKFDEHMTAFRILGRFDHKEYTRAVLDFNTNTMYNITNGVCVKSVKPAWFEESIRCLPDDAEYVGDYLVGGEKDGWHASYWRAHNVTKLIKYLEIGFSKNCFPVYENMRYAFGDTQIISSFANVADHIKAPEMFDVPPSCKNSVAKDFTGHQSHHPRSPT